MAIPPPVPSRPRPRTQSSQAARQIRPRPDRPRPAPSRPVPLVEAGVPVLRVRIMALLIVLALSVLVARLWYLQVVVGDNLHEQARSNRTQDALHTAPRGLVVDAKGRALITNGAQFTVFVNPLEMPRKKAERQVVLDRLAPIIGLTPDELADVMKRNQNGPSNPVAVAENINQHTLARVAESSLYLPGISVEPEPMRRYPQGKTAAHVVGYIGPISAEEYAEPEIRDRGYRPTDLIGKAGLEKRYDALLNGTPGGTKYEVDAKGRRQRAIGKREATPGAVLKLSLNLDVQRAAEQALSGMKGAAVAVDVRDGSVIALASAPQFDPNLLARRPLKASIYRDKIAPGEFNRATLSAVPPGSTFKIITAAAGLSEGVITPYSGQFCAGGMRIGTFKRCHAHHGYVNLNSALAASCDTFFYAASLRMGPEKIAEWSRRFGLGDETGIDLTVDRGGTVPTPAWKRKMAKRYRNPDARWYPGETASFSIGQGGLQTTPLQIALAYAAIANGGTVWEPHLVRAAVGSDGKIVYRPTPKVRSRLNLAPEHLRAIQQGLRATIAGPRGTARHLALKQVPIAGKTGSAEAGGKNDMRSHGWFACYAPYDKPQIAICIFLESDGHNYHGGANAGPVAKAMLRSYFGLRE